MRMRLTQFLLLPIATLFCMIAYSSTLPDADQSGVVGGRELVTQEPLLLLAAVEKFPVCVILPNGKYMTKYLTRDQIDKLEGAHPQDVAGRGECENVKSPS